MEQEFCPDHGLVDAMPSQTCPYCGANTLSIDDETWYGVVAGPAREKTGIERQNEV